MAAMIGDSVSRASFSFTGWFQLPLELRRRWWRETDYGEQPASTELLTAIKAAQCVARSRRDGVPLPDETALTGAVYVENLPRTW